MQGSSLRGREVVGAIVAKEHQLRRVRTFVPVRCRRTDNRIQAPSSAQVRLDTAVKRRRPSGRLQTRRSPIGLHLDREEPEDVKDARVGSRGRRPGRRAALIVLLAAPIAGAAIFAGLHPPPEFRYRAEANVLGGDGEAASESLERLAGTLLLPQILRATGIAVGSPQPISPEHVTVREQDGAGILRVAVRDRARETALRVAESLVAHAIIFLETGNAIRDESVAPIADFEDATDGLITTSAFTSPPSRAKRTSRTARYGEKSLRVSCRWRPACGVSLRVPFPFREGGTYLARVWARSASASARTPVSLVMGAKPSDFAAGRAEPLRKGWHSYQVEWSPRRSFSRADIALQIQGRAATIFYLDGVSLRTSGARRVKDAPAFRAARNRLLPLPARAAGKLEPNAAPWALRGAGLGLAVGLAAVAAGAAASRRRDRQQEA